MNYSRIHNSGADRRVQMWFIACHCLNNQISSDIIIEIQVLIKILKSMIYELLNKFCDIFIKEKITIQVFIKILKSMIFELLMGALLKKV